jgi:hypothetical protein
MLALINKLFHQSIEEASVNLHVYTKIINDSQPKELNGANNIDMIIETDSKIEEV